MENLLIFVAVENWEFINICRNSLHKEVERISSRIKDTSHMIDIIDNLNDTNLPENSVLLSFDVKNMFPSTDNETGMKAVKKVLHGRESKNPTIEYILEPLRICLECNNSVFNNKNFIQTDGTAQGSCMSCSYSDIFMAHLTTEMKITLSDPQFNIILTI